MLKKIKAIKKISSVVICLGIVLLLSINMKTVAYAQLTGTITASSANIRAEASTSSEVLASVVKNDQVSIAGEVTDSDGVLWYQVHVDATTKGYIAASLVTKSGDTEPVTSVQPTTSDTTTATTTTTTVTSTETIDSESDWKSATIAQDSVRVRADASTSSSILATVTKGVVLTVTGSKTGTDSNEWYQVSFSVDGTKYLGFIRSDLVSFDSESAEATAQVDGIIDPNNEENDEAEEVVEEVEPTVEPTMAPTVAKAFTTIGTDEIVEVPSGYIEVPIAIEGGETKGWKNGDFYILYVKTEAGDEGWYRYDSIGGVYQRYLESESLSTLDGSNQASNKMIIYILVGAVALLFIITIFLIIKISDMKMDLQYAEEEDADNEEYEEETDEEYEEDASDNRREIRRNQQEDIRLARELDHVLEEKLTRNEHIRTSETYNKKEDVLQKKSRYEDPEEYLKPDDDDDWDEEFDFIDIE